MDGLKISEQSGHNSIVLAYAVSYTLLARVMHAMESTSMPAKDPLWLRVYRSLKLKRHNTYSVSQEFGCNKNTASITLNALVRRGYATKDEHNWFHAIEIGSNE